MTEHEKSKRQLRIEARRHWRIEHRKMSRPETGYWALLRHEKLYDTALTKTKAAALREHYITLCIGE